VYDTVHFDVKVLNDVLTRPSGRVDSQAVVEARVRRDVEKAAAVFRQCGVEAVVDRVVFIADPNVASNGATGSVLRDGTTSLTTEENALLGTDRSANDFAVNVYYIHHFTEPNPAAPPPTRTVPLVGFTYSNDYFAGIPNSRNGIIIARFSPPAGAAGGVLSTGATDNTLSHELEHFLLDSYTNPHGSLIPGDEHRLTAGCLASDPNSFFLMHRTDCLTLWKIEPEECTNMLTNPDESAYVEQF